MNILVASQSRSGSVNTWFVQNAARIRWHVAFLLLAAPHGFEGQQVKQFVFWVLLVSNLCSWKQSQSCLDSIAGQDFRIWRKVKPVGGPTHIKLYLTCCARSCDQVIFCDLRLLPRFCSRLGGRQRHCWHRPSEIKHKHQKNGIEMNWEHFRT